MAPVLIVIGLALFMLGFCYLFKPHLIIRLNAFMRDTFFKDSVVYLSNRRIGGLLLLMSFLLLVLVLSNRP
jgi:hypothetical protein